MKINDIQLQTAAQMNERCLYRMWHDWVPGRDGETGHFVECVIPDPIIAQEYLEANRPFEEDIDGWPLYRHLYTRDQVDDCKKKVSQFIEMHLDMRDQIVTACDGKVGLKDVTGKIIVPSIFNDIPERYSCLNKDRGFHIPVIKDGRYYLYDLVTGKVQTDGYDRIYRYFGGYLDYYVVQQDGSLGILYANELEVPAIMDEIYEMQDPDGCIPFEKDGKWGVYQLGVYAPPIFERLEVWSEDYVKVWLNGKQGWVDTKGRFTMDKNEACIGSWYDTYK